MDAQINLSVKVTKDLIQSIVTICSLSEQEILHHTELEKYGFDSITLTELTNNLNKKLGLKLTPALFFEMKEITVHSIAQQLCAKYPQELAVCYSEPSGSAKSSNLGSKDIAAEPELVFRKTQPSAASSAGEALKDSGFVPVNTAKAVNPFRTVARVTGLREEPLASQSAGGDLPEEARPAPALNERVTMDEPQPCGAVAIIGIGGVMPQSDNLEEFWDHLVKGNDLITEIPSERWDWQAFYGDPMKETNKSQCKWGGFLKDAASFDPLFFRMSPNEALLLDPQQRKFLETVWQTIEDAGYSPSSLAGSQTGVFVGVTNNEYTDLIAESGLPVDAHSIVSNAHFLIANRTSYIFDFHGPSEAVDTACSSSAVALHRAVMSLQAGECRLAVAGGVNLLASPRSMAAFDKAGMLSKSGRCSTFDKQADGFVRGEGIGALLLKPLAQAEADRDLIYAVIRGTAVNHSGRSKSFTAPNPSGQAAVIKDAVARGGIDPSAVSYIEVHGTATTLGDTVELEGIKNAFAELGKQRGTPTVPAPACGLGSVKSNAGHLEAASGMASLLKVILALRAKELPPSIHCGELNPFIQLDDSPFYIVRERQEWRQPVDASNRKLPRVAGINVFGAGGVNAHIIIGEYEQPASPEPAGTDEPVVMVFSAKTKDSLREIVKATAAFAEDDHRFELRNAAYTLQTGRDEMEERVAFVIQTAEEFVEKARLYASGQAPESEDGIFETAPPTVKQGICDLMSQDATSRLYVDMLLQSKQWFTIAKLWVNGVSVEWAKLHPAGARSRLRLPTYRFAKQRYWIARSGELNRSREGVPSASGETEKRSTFTVQESIGPEEAASRYFGDRISSMLGIRPEELRMDKELQEFGFDSIMAMKFKYEVENELGLTLPMEVLGESRCIKDLAARIVSDPGQEELRKAITGTCPEPEIESLETEQLDALFESLNRKLHGETVLP
ncbi:beta-ketoacyl synthase N-terminal-like domain-containing protein [Paenibacillus sp. P32E]|uniref:beta-ketoacyl synthase N-terminal-like domain-containing protein n=1 Tax=Paenibacillus sp. P32E TaxID=1349434 RepID=UPI00093D46BD|nr:beta-ketoacyl synthase N-terminal-like domain-containing protein [Paenibacillus sp. P32E]OKP94479.1 hypothetical protein A3848_00365 [Paenibacillus sp. P32E]